MGVMSCHNQECTNIMCDTYIQGIGYICNDCQSSFKEWLKFKGKSCNNEFELEVHLKEFMNSNGAEYPEFHNIDIDEYFRNNTRH